MQYEKKLIGPAVDQEISELGKALEAHKFLKFSNRGGGARALYYLPSRSYGPFELC
jgi:hypothetical protein